MAMLDGESGASVGYRGGGEGGGTRGGDGAVRLRRCVAALLLSSMAAPERKQKTLRLGSLHSQYQEQSRNRSETEMCLQRSHLAHAAKQASTVAVQSE